MRYYGRHDVRVEDAPEPQTPQHGQVIVEPTFCGICGTDLHEYESGPIFTPRTPNAYSGAILPQILGHEFAGRVTSVGPGVETLSLETACRSSRRSAQEQTISAAAISPSWGQGPQSSALIGHGAAWRSAPSSTNTMRSACPTT
ncbi:alcohol dehydrogenase catalytic domain-containing protein [Rhizobium ruizarguesonis]